MTTKKEAMQHWRDLPTGIDPLPVMQPIPYRAGGSKYGCCGIRIDGSPEFVDAVISNLKSLLAGENGTTRLELARRRVTRSEGFKAGENADDGAEVCYIRLHERGREARMMNARYGFRG